MTCVLRESERRMDPKSKPPAGKPGADKISTNTTPTVELPPLNEPRSHLLPRTPRGSLEADAPLSSEDIQALANSKESLTYSEAAPKIEDTFTAENLRRFLFGELTWGQLHAVTADDAFEFAQHAYEQYRAGRYFDAKKIYQALILIDPYDPYYHVMHGASLQMLDERDAALDEYTAAVQLDDRNIQGFVNRAELYLELGRFEDAQRDLQRIRLLDPEGKTAASQRARTLAAAVSNALGNVAEIVKKG